MGNRETTLLQEMARLSVEDLLLPLLVQLILIIAVGRIFAALFRRIGQPAVVGEIAAGLILGPSLLGWAAPEVFQMVFRPEIAGLPVGAADVLLSKVLTALSQIGLILLLFLIGLEFDFDHLKWHGKSALAISLAGIAIPFALGVGLGWVVHPLVAEQVPLLGFVLFLGTAMSITAIPVLGRMMVEWGITRTRVAAITITSAAADDAVGWILLAAIAALTRSQFDPLQTLGMIGATVAFALFMIFAARPLLSRLARHMLAAGKGEIGVNGLAAILVILFVCSVVTNLIGIFAVFGAFSLGAALSGEVAFREAINRKLRDVVTCFFLPIFFAYTGLRTNIGTLESWHLWLIAMLVWGVAIAGKLGGCTLAAWLGGVRLREAACVGIMMNTRGLMELVVINVGKDLGIIPDSVYCMLVLMALLTTFMTTPLLMRFMRGTELEPCIEASGLLRGGTAAEEEP